MDTQLIIPIVCALMVLVVVCIIFRELVCWYWKINRQIELQEETNVLLQKLLDQNTREDPADTKTISEQSSVNNPEIMERVTQHLNTSSIGE